MSKYGQYCPMSRAVEVLGDRWTLLIVRDLICGATHFNELERGLPGISKSLLAERLKRLQGAGVIDRQPSAAGQKVRYQLTEAGQDLYPIIESLTRWGTKWIFGEPQPEELDPLLLMWWIRGRIYPERLPGPRVVVEFDFQETRPRRYWLVLKPDDVSVCTKYPGFETDVLVTSELKTFYQVWLGRISFKEALAMDKIHLEALPGLMRAFPDWFALSRTVEMVGDILRQQEREVEPPGERGRTQRCCLVKPSSSVQSKPYASADKV
jgi:DNA-binding HxlR family transcriptional regulator